MDSREGHRKASANAVSEVKARRLRPRDARWRVSSIDATPAAELGFDAPSLEARVGRLANRSPKELARDEIPIAFDGFGALTRAAASASVRSSCEQSRSKESAS